MLRNSRQISVQKECEIYSTSENQPKKNYSKEVNESSSLKDFNILFEKYILQALPRNHERYHHETLILDASLTHVSGD